MILTAKILDGFERREIVTFTIHPLGADSITIQTPLHNQELSAEVPYLFHAIAHDAQNNSLCEGISWESDLDGIIGTGCNLNTQLSK